MEVKIDWKTFGILPLSAIVVTVVVCLFVGCGRGEVTVQLDGTNGVSNGLCFYEPLPYLLVASAEGTSNLTAQIVWLPNPNRRYRVNLTPGIGTANLSVKLQNGWMLESIGAQTDTKMPETITAIGGVVKAVAGAERTLASRSEFAEGLYLIDIGKDGVITLRRNKPESG